MLKQTAIALFTLFVLFQLTWALFLIPGFQSHSPTPMPDMQAFASAGTILQQMHSWPQEARQSYRTLFFIDLAYPLVYGSSFFILILYLTRRFPPPAAAAPLYRMLPFIPAAAALFDYLENTAQITLLNLASSLSPAALPDADLSLFLQLKPFFTTMKFLLLALSAALMLLLPLIHLISRKTSSSPEAGNDKRE